MHRFTEGLRADDGRDVIRVVAGILIGVALLLAALRRGSPEFFGDNTSNFGLFVILGLAAGFLYATGIVGRVLSGTDRRWQALFTVMGTLILPFALYRLIATIDSGYDDTLAALIVFAASAAACVAAWLIARVRFQLLLASIYGAIAFLALLDKILSDDLASNLDTNRWLLLAFAAALLVAAFLVRRRAVPERLEREPLDREGYPLEGGSRAAGGDRYDDVRGGYPDGWESRSDGRDAPSADLITGAGLVALLAFALGPLVALLFAVTFGSIPTDASSSGELVSGIGGQETYWDILTLLSGIALVLFGLGRGYRGPVYVGGAMLLLFLLSVGLDLDDSSPEGTIVGWPLIVGIVGAGLFLLSLAPGLRLPGGASRMSWFDGRGERDAWPAWSGGGEAPAATAVAPVASEHAPVTEPAEPVEPVEPPIEHREPPISEPAGPVPEDPEPPTRRLDPDPEPPTRRLDPDPEPRTERLDEERGEDRPPPPPPA